MNTEKFNEGKCTVELFVNVIKSFDTVAHSLGIILKEGSEIQRLEELHRVNERKRNTRLDYIIRQGLLRNSPPGLKFLFFSHLLFPYRLFNLALIILDYTLKKSSKRY